MSAGDVMACLSKTTTQSTITTKIRNISCMNFQCPLLSAFVRSCGHDHECEHLHIPSNVMQIIIIDRDNGQCYQQWQTYLLHRIRLSYHLIKRWSGGTRCGYTICAVARLQYRRRVPQTTKWLNWIPRKALPRNIMALAHAHKTNIWNSCS